jgi:hypothetical protein
MISNLVLNEILTNLRKVAKGDSTKAEAFAQIRADVPTLFPEYPTMADIKAVTDSDEWKEFDAQGRLIFAESFFTSPREVGGEIVDATRWDVTLWTADKKTAKTFSETETKIRKASKDYVRVAFRQNVTKLIPKAVDAPVEVEAEKLPDPTGVLALVTEALITLSEKSPDGALALLNGLDNLVKVARPHVSSRQPIPRKA